MFNLLPKALIEGFELLSIFFGLYGIIFYLLLAKNNKNKLKKL